MRWAQEQMLRGGQVICGRNVTRIQLNLGMKEAAGFPGVYPSGAGEKIICLKNRNDLGVVNGMFLELSDIQDENEHAFSAVVRTEDGTVIGAANGTAPRFTIYKGHFDEHVQPDPERDRRDHWIRKGLIEAVWGYAITCHKSQGSQWRTSWSSTTASAAPPRTGRAGSTPRSPAPRRGW